MMGKYVITGGPSCGKTTIINELASLGYNTLPETARQVILEESKKPNGITPQRDFRAFQELLAEKGTIQERQLTDPVFLDRSIIDITAYCKLKNVITPTILSAIRPNRYTAIFLLDQLPLKQDGVRYETQNEATQVHKLISEAYTANGYTPIQVPVMPIQERVQFILNKINLRGETHANI